MYPQSDTWLELTKVGDTVNGTFTNKYQSDELTGDFIAKRCKCDITGNGACKPL
jgi:hypothetical protein